MGTPIGFTGQSSGTTHDWDLNGEASSSGNHKINYTFKTAGLKTITYITTLNSVKCTTTLQLTVRAGPTLKFNTTNDLKQCNKGNLFCFIDSSYNPNGAKVKYIKYVFSNGQLETDSNPAFPKKYCVSLLGINGGSYDLYLLSIDENGCETADTLNDLVSTYPAIGPGYKFNAPIGCDSTIASVEYNGTLDTSLIKKVNWYWDDDQSLDTGRLIAHSHVYRKQGYFFPKIIVESIHGCWDSFKRNEKVVLFPTDARILSLLDTVCLLEPTFQFGVSEIPKDYQWFKWTFGDYNQTDLGTNDYQWKLLEYAYTGLGSYQVKLEYYSIFCGLVTMYDTVHVLGPHAKIEVPLNRVPEHQVFQCEKPVQDTVFFTNNSTYYHNDRNYSDDDSVTINNGEYVYHFGPDQKPILKKSPMFRGNDCTLSIWNFGDKHTFQCTTDTKNNVNKFVNCNYSVDSAPHHYYRPWEDVMIDTYQDRYMEDNIYVDSLKRCSSLRVYPSDTLYLIEDSILYIPPTKADNELADSLYPGVKHRIALSTKFWVGPGKMFMDQPYKLSLNAGSEVWFAINDSSTFTKVVGPNVLLMSKDNVIKTLNATDTVFFGLYLFITKHNIPKDIYNLITTKKGYSSTVLVRSFLTHGGIKGVDYDFNFQRFRDVFYAKIPECYKVELKIADTCNKRRCNSLDYKNVVIMDPKAGGAGTRMSVDISGCLNEHSISNDVGFDFHKLKPGCTFAEVWINPDSGATDTFIKAVFNKDNTEYKLFGNPPDSYKHKYLKMSDPGGCVTVGVVTKNGISQSGRGLCTDTQWYHNLVCLDRIDPEFEILSPRADVNGHHHACKWEKILARPTKNNKTKFETIKSQNWSFASLDWLLGYPYAYNLIEEYFHMEPLPQSKLQQLLYDSLDYLWDPAKYNQDSVKKWKQLLFDKTKKKLFNYVVITKTRFYTDPWKCGNDSITKKFEELSIDTFITGFATAWDTLLTQQSMSEMLIVLAEEAGFDYNYLTTEKLTKMIWNGVGTIGDPSTGSKGCLDTTGIGGLLDYAVIPRYTYHLHPRDSSLAPIDTAVTGLDTIWNGSVIAGFKPRVEHVYSFSSQYPASFKLGYNPVTQTGNCTDKSEKIITVGFKSKLHLSDSFWCAKNSAALKLMADVRYFKWNKFNELDSNDIWRDSTRQKEWLSGNQAREHAEWDWDHKDDDSTIPATTFGGHPYGGNGIGMPGRPWVNPADFGSPAMWKRDSGAYIVKVQLTDSTGCRDTAKRVLIIKDLRTNFGTDINSPDCNMLVEFFDSSKLNVAKFIPEPECGLIYRQQRERIFYASIDWGDGTLNEFFQPDFSPDPLLPAKIAHQYWKPGDYKIVYRNISRWTCEDSMARMIHIPGPDPRFKFAGTDSNELSICLGDTARFENTSSPGTLKADWTWHFGDSVFANTPQKFLGHIYTKPGRYKVYLEEYDSIIIPPNIRRYCRAEFPNRNAGDSFMWVNVLSRAALSGKMGKSVLCPGDENVFTDSSNAAYGSWSWTIKHDPTGATTTDSGSAKILRKRFYTPGNYTVIHRAYFSGSVPYPRCPTPPDTFRFYVDSVKADFDIDSSGNPDFCFTRKDVNGNSYRWGFAHADDITISGNNFLQDLQSQNVKVCHSYSSGGRSWVCLLVTNPSGCTDTVCKPVSIQLYLFISNVFTPGNGDGLNDTYRIPINGYDLFEIRIFNRWGEQVFRSEDPARSWNGKVNNTGADLPSGTFFYQLTYRFPGDLKVTSVEGTVNLIR